MGKYTNTTRMSKKEQDELFAEFAKALASVKNPAEAASLLRDIYSEQEALMLARRLKVARLLEEGLTYQQIHQSLKVSQGTIAKVQAWLRVYGDGCRLVFKRSKKRTVSKAASSWRIHKKRYPMYYWPELLLDEIIRKAGRREKARLLKVIKGMKEKTRLTKQLLTLLGD